MSHVTLANGTQVEWELDRKTAELILLGSGPGEEPLWMFSRIILPPKSGCFPRMQRPLAAGNGLLLLTDGEHERGATSHFGELHFVGADGVWRWSLPIHDPHVLVQCGDVVVGSKERAIGGFDLVARRISLANGKPHLERRIHCTGGSPTTFVTVERTGDKAVIRCSGTWGEQRITI